LGIVEKIFGAAQTGLLWTQFLEFIYKGFKRFLLIAFSMAATICKIKTEYNGREVTAHKLTVASEIPIGQTRLGKK
jgi:hypothetical protein